MTRYKYTPDRAGYDELKANFIGREGLYNRLIRIIKSSSGKGALSHCLVIGPRGIGKSHLLKLIYYYIKDNCIADWTPLKFSEEEYYSISSLEDFLFKTIEYLQREDPGVTEEMIFKFDYNKNSLPADRAIEYLKNYTKKTNKKIIILPENMHKIMDQMSEHDLEKLRGILIEHEPFLIMGSALSVFDQIVNHKEPFYNFFECIPVEELSNEEVELLISTRAKYENKNDIEEKIDEFRPKILAINRITGGNPRLVLLLYELIIEQELSSVEEAFVRMLEDQTPYYQYIMDSLPPQQMKIVDRLSQSDTTLTPTEISKDSGMELSSVTAQITRLVDNRILRPIKLTKKRHTRYEVSDRLFRNWRRWRTPAGRESIEFLIDFLKIWYSPDEIKSHIDKTLMNYQDGNSDLLKKEIIYLLEALPAKDRAQKISDVMKVCEETETARYLEEMDKKTKGEIESEESEKIINSLRLVAKARRFMLKGKKKTAESFLMKALEYLPIENESINKHEFFFVKGSILSGLGSNQEALSCLDKAIAIYDKDKYDWYSRGDVLKELEQYEEALKSYDKAIAIDNEYFYAWYSKGNLLKNLKCYIEALTCLDKAIAIDDKYEYCWTLKGAIFEELKQYEEALKSYDKAIAINAKNTSTWYFKGNIFSKKGSSEEALYCYDRAISIDENYLYAWASKGHLFMNLEQYREAIDSYDKAINIDSKDSYSLFFKACCLKELGEISVAETVCLQSAQLVQERNFDLLKSIASLLNSMKKYGTTYKIIEQYLGNNADLRQNNYEDLLALKFENLVYMSIEAMNVGDVESAKKWALAAVDIDKMTNKDAQKSGFVRLFAKTFSSGHLSLANELIASIGKKENKDLLRLIKPFANALEYLETGDKEILERLQSEEREIVEEISTLPAKKD